MNLDALDGRFIPHGRISVEESADRCERRFIHAQRRRKQDGAHVGSGKKLVVRDRGTPMTLAKALWIIVIATGCTGRSRVAAQEGPPPASEEAAETRVINLTDAAVRALVELLGPGELRREDHPLRVSVEGTAATGYSYYFGFADDPNEPQYKVDEARDYIQVVKGFPIAVRREHVRYLKGITIDYVESPTEGAGFKFENPGGTLEAIIAREQQ